jgi:hypothetical protein
LNGGEGDEEKKTGESESNDGHTHLVWLQKLIDLNDSEHQDIITSKQMPPVE